MGTSTIYDAAVLIGTIHDPNCVDIEDIDRDQ